MYSSENQYVIVNYKTPLTLEGNKRLKVELTDLISKKIKEIRQKQNITQQELAEKAGLHLTYIGHLEAGKYHPSVFVLWKIANVLNVSLDKFV